MEYIPSGVVKLIEIMRALNYPTILSLLIPALELWLPTQSGGGRAVQVEATYPVRRYAGGMDFTFFQRFNCATLRKNRIR